MDAVDIADSLEIIKAKLEFIGFAVDRFGGECPSESLAAGAAFVIGDINAQVEAAEKAVLGLPRAQRRS
jgi:hypothetical protein